MKKSFKLVSLLAVAGSVFFSSCKKEDETPAVTAVASYSAKLLGAQSNANHSFFSPATGLTYASGDSATFATNKVDISLYNATATGGLSFLSLDARGGAGLKKVRGVSRNTAFKLSNFTVAQFDTLTNEIALDNVTATSSEVEIAANNVYQFINEEGKAGLIKVTAADQGTAYNGSATISVKVQK